MDLGISETEFYRLKGLAVEKVAWFLGCTIFEEEYKHWCWLTFYLNNKYDYLDPENLNILPL